MLSEYDENKYKDSYKEHGIHSKSDLEQLIKVHRDNYVSEIFSNESFIEDIYRTILENTDYWTTLADYRAVFTSTEHAMDFTANLAPSTRFNSQFGVITLSVLETGGNRYRIEGSLGDIYFEPPNARIYICNILDFQLIGKQNQDIYNIIVMDPPWPVGARNPTRGVSLNYSTLSLNEFKRINIPLQYFHFGRLLFIWVTNYSYLATLQWATSLNYYLEDTITWIKKYNSGILHKSLGYFIQHSQETCLIFRRKQKPTLHYNDTFNENVTLDFPNYFTSNVFLPSAKPDYFYKLLDHCYPNCNKIEFFARDNNSRPDWSFVGLELTPNAHLSFLNSVRTVS
eukprot:snap_masked-scaffold_2-processed-gene-18.33-mRNA-1 protein AED:1.00 eAED:1.00 QI:0/0/0/0/1/1/2/0/340